MTPLSLVEKLQLASWLVKELTGDQFKVAYVLLFYFHNSKKGDLFPSYSQQADAANVSRSTAIRTVKILEKNGVLVVERTDGGLNKRNRYTLKMVSLEDPSEGNGVTSGPLTVSPEDPASVTNGPLTVSPADPHISRNVNKEKNKECIKEGGTPAVRQPSSSKKLPGLRGTRLNESWQLSESGVAYARELGMPEEMIERESMKFKNHWLAAAGAKGIKCDWPRTWQTWCIRSIEFMANNQKARGSATAAMVETLQRRGNA